MLSNNPEELIFLGYDIMRQATYALHQGSLIKCEDSERASQVLNGLTQVGEWLNAGKPVEHQFGPMTDEDGVEVHVVIQTPWQLKVAYSDQAWNDLLEIGHVV